MDAGDAEDGLDAGRLEAVDDEVTADPGAGVAHEMTSGALQDGARVERARAGRCDEQRIDLELGDLGMRGGDARERRRRRPRRQRDRPRDGRARRAAARAPRSDASSRLAAAVVDRRERERGVARAPRRGCRRGRRARPGRSARPAVRRRSARRRPRRRPCARRTAAPGASVALHLERGGVQRGGVREPDAHAAAIRLVHQRRVDGLEGDRVEAEAVCDRDGAVRVASRRRRRGTADRPRPAARAPRRSRPHPRAAPRRRAAASGAGAARASATVTSARERAHRLLGALVHREAGRAQGRAARVGRVHAVCDAPASPCSPAARRGARPRRLAAHVVVRVERVAAEVARHGDRVDLAGLEHDARCRRERGQLGLADADQVDRVVDPAVRRQRGVELRDERLGETRAPARPLAVRRSAQTAPCPPPSPITATRRPRGSGERTSACTASTSAPGESTSSAPAASQAARSTAWSETSAPVCDAAPRRARLAGARGEHDDGLPRARPRVPPRRRRDRRRRPRRRPRSHASRRARRGARAGRAASRRPGCRPTRSG